MSNVFFKQFREIRRGEFIIIAGDTSAGGADYNACQFLSKTNIDVPLVYHSRGIATNMTNAIYPVIEKIYDVTGIQPTVVYEVNNGGVFELQRLATLNRLNKYSIFLQRGFGRVVNDMTTRIGWSTNTATRPKMLSDLKDAVDNKVLRIYDKGTIEELFPFIINKQGKPIAEAGQHDDRVMALSICWQLYQTENKTAKKAGGGIPYRERNWGISSMDAYR
jgi:hypothetical protein